MLNAGTAYIAVKPDLRGFRAGVTKGVGNLNTIGDSAGRSIGGRLAGTAGTVLKRGLQTGAAGAAALAGTALVKGFGRLKALEDAEAKLTGLGHTAKSVDNIMADALASVKGTAFGLDEAATTAAGAVAAGVKPGKDLERTLTLVADAATIGGASMGEMGAIFNKVATSNKVQGEVIAQLSDRGIPIVQLLAKEMGKSGEQVMELSRTGKIGFTEFRVAMESGLGGAAQESGKTLTGAFKNTSAALGRIGANLLSGVYPQVQKFFTGAIGFLAPFEAKAGAAGEAIGKTLAGGIELAADAFARIRSSLSGGMPGDGFLTEVKETVGAVVGFVRQLMPTIRTVVGDVAAVVGPALRDIGRMVGDELLPAFRRMLPILLPVSKFLLKLFGTALVGLIKGVVQAVKGFVNVIAGVFNLISSLVRGEWGQAWEAFKQILTGTLDVVIGLFKAWFNFGIFAVFRSGIKALLGSWRSLGAGLRSVGTKMWSTIQSLFSRALAALGRLLWAGVRGYFRLWGRLFSMYRSIAVNGWRVLRSRFGGALAAIRTVITESVRAFLRFWRGLFAGLLRMAVRGWQTVRGGFAKAFGVIRSLFTDAVGVYVGFWRGLFNLLRGISSRGMAVVRDGIKSALGKITGAFRAGVQAIGTAWDKIKAAAKKPVEFVVNTVLNKGLIDSFNWVAGKVGAPTIGHIQLGWASGGYTGNLDPRRVAGFVHGDEHVIRSKSRRTIEAARPGFLDALNTHGARALGGYFLGGRVPTRAARVSQHSGYPWARWAGDINGPGEDYGQAVTAWKSGVVAAVKHLTSSYGNHVRVNHGAEQSLYAHLSQTLVRVGQRVAAGQMLGRLGSTGNSSGPHLHFEVSGGSAPLGEASVGGGGGVPGWMRRILAGAVKWLRGRVEGLANLGGRFGDSPLTQLVSGIPRKLVSVVADKIENLVSGAKHDRIAASAGNAANVAGNAGARATVQAMAARMGWTGAQWGALSNLIAKESGWNPNAANPSSSARGLFQKMTSIHGALEPTVAGQARWGLNYIRSRYGSPLGAWAHSQRVGWYDTGGILPHGGVAMNASGRPERVLDPRTTANFERFTATLDAHARRGHAGRSGRTSRITGTLDSAWGPVEVEGMIEDRLSDHRRHDAARAATVYSGVGSD